MSDTIKVAMVSAVASVVITAGVFVGLVEPEIADPTPETPAISADCPKGWTDESDEAADTIVYTCTKDGWIVILTPDKKFERAWKEGRTDWTTNPEVAGWPER